MIGGYVYRAVDADLDARLRDRIRDSHTRIDVGDFGYLFHDQPFSDQPTSRLISDELTVLSEDLLVAAEPGGEYRRLGLSSDFAEVLERDGAASAFDAIAGDCRMAVVRRRGAECRLLLASHRAGSGRIYYRSTGSGVVFSSDLRFLLQVVRSEVSPLGVYAILKYGAVPEPLTICENIRAVPPAHYLEHDLQTGEERILPFFKLRFPCDTEEAGGEDEYLAPAKRNLQRSARFLAAHRPAILLSGGIDSSLYGCYLSEAVQGSFQGFYCAFGEDDPELEHAEHIGKRVGAQLRIARMGRPDALGVLRDVVRWTDHPFSDFSSLPITFLLKFAKEHMGETAVLVECNGGDDCFGFPDLGNEAKYRLKHRFPRPLKRAIAAVLRGSARWKWEGRGGTLARLAALADTHERDALDYFLVLAPAAYLGLRGARERDEALAAVMGEVFSRCGEGSSWEAKTTVRQLMHVNSRRWAAKALSVGESLGIRVVYPYIWREILEAQGRVPWSAKIRDGVVKWPLKRLLEEYMPGPFIYRKKSGFVPPFATWLTDAEFNGMVREVLLDKNAVVAGVVPTPVLESLISDAAEGRRLRHAILNFLWGALFTEMWVGEHVRR